MALLSEYAKGVGPAMDMIVASDSRPDNLVITDLVRNAQAAGLQVHPYTFRRDPERMPGYADSFESLLAIFFEVVGVDGVFTDFPDLAVRYLDTRQD